MRTLTNNCVYAILTACLFALISGCGSGDGNASSGLTYTGSTSPATLTPDNSATLVGGAYTGGNSGIIIGGVTAGLTNYDFGASRRPRSLVLSDTLLKFVHLTSVDDTLARPEIAATINNIPSSTLHGNCGGTAIVNGSYDDGNKMLSLTANISNYCQDGTTLNGTVGASGQAIADARNNINISSISITLAQLTASYDRDSFTAAGSMTITPQAGYTYIANNNVLTIDMLFRDNATTKVFKLENFTISESLATDTSTYADMTITGRYYAPDEGYIELSTPAIIRVMAGDDWPSSGSLRGTGNNGSATLTALDNNAYRLDVDSDNNGTADYTENDLWGNL
jgi:hypothetical protein